jgi:geranylgeranyl diphosphate synthase type II
MIQPVTELASAHALADFFAHARVQIDSALERYLPRPPACPPVVSEAMRYSLFAGGKRLRPTITLAAADAVARAVRPEGSSLNPVAAARDDALPAACAVELIHTYSLIHDDLPAMDNDTLRRGRPTLHVVYGDGIAVLAGDGLQAEAFALLAREPATLDPAVVARKLRVVGVIAGAAGSTGMVGGQAIDLQAAGQTLGEATRLDAQGLRDMHARKTGAMIRASAVAGAIMAGARDRVVEAVDRYASEIGLAFQIVDDILDVEGSAQELGKTAGKDAAEDKPTYASLYGVARSRELAADCVERAGAALIASGLVDGHLGAIANWVVSRKS